MTPEEWQKLRPILESALEMDGVARTAFLREACRDTGQRSEIESLIESHERAGTDVLASVELPEQMEDTFHFRLVPGRRIGVYEVLDEIAEGGMGAVYRAVRADGQYRQQVAIKIIRADLGTEQSAARFRNEQQILANLNHPHIAKILDGGTTPDGIPYFVMEFIDGLPITEYCQKNELSIDERLQLFREVCAAVHHAHQHLVIHRDIKPTNILITVEGVPKLLDFGIAKILDPALPTASLTVAGGGLFLMPPEYASPEQLRGGTITTATDVYALGLVLYEVLVGRRAYCFSSPIPHEMARMVLETDPEKPSTATAREGSSRDRQTTDLATGSAVAMTAPSREKIRRKLSGDLDNIVMKAIRKEPEMRYSSADQLSEDLRRHLEGQPILARKSTLAYRARKYFLRHKVAVTAAALVLLSLVGGIFFTGREARIARANELRAERRFNDVRKLANSLLYDIHDSIQNLPGATPARKLLLDQGLQYLDSLAKEAAGDASLQRELASAYTRIASLQGSTVDANLGQFDAGLASMSKALAIREAVAAANPTNAKDRLELAIACRAVARMLATAGKPSALEPDRRALAITEKLLQSDPSNFDVLGERSKEFELLGDFQDDPGVAVEAYRNSIAITRGLAKEHPEDKRVQRGLAMITTKIGIQLSSLGRRSEALEYTGSGVNLYESLAKDQADARLRRELGTALSFRANIFLANGDPQNALAVYQRAVTIAEPLAKADPQNMIVHLDLAGDYGGIGIALAQHHKYGEAEAMFTRAIQLYEASAGSNADPVIPLRVGSDQLWIAETLVARARWREAEAAYRQGIGKLEKLKTDGGGGTEGDCELASGYLRLADLLARRRNPLAAEQEYRKALAVVERFASATPPDAMALYVVADASFGIGELARSAAPRSKTAEARSQKLTEAADWYRKSNDAWSKIPNPGALSENFLPCGNPKRVAAALAKTEVALRGLQGR